MATHSPREGEAVRKMQWKAVPGLAHSQLDARQDDR
jgi:hypothetical protein